MAVLIFHLNIFMSIVLPYEGWQGIPRIFQSRLTNGNFAVCIFFVLSGYVLVRPFVRSGDLASAGEAALRRYFRLTPVALASVLLSYLAWQTIGFSTKAMAYYGPGFGWMAETYQFTPSLTGAIYNGLIGIYAGDNAYNGPLWTIGIELWGSIFLFGYAALFIKSRNLILISVITSATLIAAFKIQGIYYSLFIAGAVIAADDRLIGKWPLVIPALYLGSIDQWSPDALALFGAVRLPLATFNDTVAPHAIAACLLLSAVLGSQAIRRALETKLAQWLGRISYSLYAIHIIVLFSAGNAVFLLVAGAGHIWLGALAAIAVTISVTMALAHLSYLYIDLPSQRLAKRLGARLIGKGAGAPTSSNSYSAPG